MYLKIKDPLYTQARKNLLAMGLLFFTFLTVVGFILAFAHGDVALAWHTVIEGSSDFFNYVRKEDGPLMGNFIIFICVLFVFLIPVLFILSVRNWYQKRQIFDTPSAVRALNFGTGGVTLYTKEQNYFLPYAETTFSLTGKVSSLRTKNRRHAFLNTLTFTFQQQKSIFKIAHKHSSNKVLYRLVDLHSRFKDFSSHIAPFSEWDSVEKNLADFLNKQIQNQRLYGYHKNCQSPLATTFIGLLFLVIGIPFFVGSLRLLAFPEHFYFSPILSLFIVAIGLRFLYLVAQDIWVSWKIKKLSNRN